MIDKERGENKRDEEQGVDPALSQIEALLLAHPDISVVRNHGEVDIRQILPAGYMNRLLKSSRWLYVFLGGEPDSTRRKPTVYIHAHDTPIHVHLGDERDELIRKYGLTTTVKVHTENDGQVTPEVVYGGLRPYPLAKEFPIRHVRFVERFSHPIPAQEIVSTARVGLEIVDAFQRATSAERARGDIEPNRVIDFDVGYLYHEVYQGHASFAEVFAAANYPLNVLNKVTDNMLPHIMPPAPGNRREARPRPAKGLSLARRRPTGR